MVTDCTDVIPEPRFFLRRLLFLLLMMVALMAGCTRAGAHYVQVDQSLQRGDFDRADKLIQSAEPEYGVKSRLLYRMDRGMTLHLAGQYESSNAILEQAEQDVEAAYTRRVRTEAKAFLVNDTELQYDGDPYEQVLINVVKALNYAAQSKWSEAVVEARRIDQRLNVLADQASNKDGYHDDAFARYLSGVLYEVSGDLNNAFIAYRNAYEAYRRTKSWSKTPLPAALPADLLRTSEALRFTEEHEEYRKTFPDVVWKPVAETGRLAQLIVISYNGRAPYKEDLFIDLPVSMEALNLVLLSKRMNRAGQSRQARAADSALYGINGSIVRVALPKLVPQKAQTAFSEVTLSGDLAPVVTQTQLVDNVTATAEKTLGDNFTAITLKAVARAAVKNALAAGAGVGTQAAMGRNSDIGPWIGLLVSVVAKAFAIYSEEADKRSWRTLPDEIQMARVWVPAGTYTLGIRPVRRSGGEVRNERPRTVTLKEGEATLIMDRVIP